jgi:hypothetical protein
MSLFKRLSIAILISGIVFVQSVSAEFVTDFRVTTLTDKTNYDLEDSVAVTMQAENHTNQDITLNFSTGCQIGLEIFLNDQLVYSEEMYPRNCSDTATSIILPKDKKAVWTRLLESSYENYPFTENGRYKIHAYLMDHENEDWYSQSTSYVNVVFGEEFLYVFNDIYEHWAKSYIEKLYDKGLVQGYEDGGFHPDASINRAELVKMALTAAGIQFSDNVDDEDFKFEDLDGWQLSPVYEAWKRGIVQGYDETSFAPAQNITRAEALKVALLAFGADIPQNPDEYTFEDTKDHWASAYINFAYLNFVVAGRPDGLFYPDDPITRAEAAKIISKLTEL